VTRKEKSIDDPKQSERAHRAAVRALRAANRCVKSREARVFLDSIPGERGLAQVVMIDGETWRKIQEALRLNREFR